MLSCRETTRLLSESQDRPLSLKEKMELRFHTVICKGCRNFGKSLTAIRSAMQSFVAGDFERRKGDDHRSDR